MPHAIAALCMIVAPFAAIYGAVWMDYRRSRRRLLAQMSRPVNVVHGVVLPEPDDPRWVACRCPDKKCGSAFLHWFRLGSIKASLSCKAFYSGIHVDGVTLRALISKPDDDDPYVEAVRLAYCARKAQESIEGTPERPCLPPAG